MKNKAKFAIIIALAAFIGFTLLSCENPLKDLFNLPAADTPYADPPAGTYSGTQIVYLHCDGPGIITYYYTTDGSTPTASSTRYTGGITISQTTTLKAIATSSTRSNSAVFTAVYNITPL